MANNTQYHLRRGVGDGMDTLSTHPTRQKAEIAAKKAFLKDGFIWKVVQDDFTLIPNKKTLRPEHGTNGEFEIWEKKFGFPKELRVRSGNLESAKRHVREYNNMCPNLKTEFCLVEIVDNQEVPIDVNAPEENKFKGTAIGPFTKVEKTLKDSAIRAAALKANPPYVLKEGEDIKRMDLSPGAVNSPQSFSPELDPNSFAAKFEPHGEFLFLNLHESDMVNGIFVGNMKQDRVTKAEVVAIGPKVEQYAVGDVILIDRNTTFDMKVDGEKYKGIKEKEVIGKYLQLTPEDLKSKET